MILLGLLSSVIVLVASVVGTTATDQEQTPVAGDPVVEPRSELFQLGDGLEPTIPGIGAIVGDPNQPGFDWADLFNADHSLKPGLPLAGGSQAFFLFDDISAGTKIDQTVRGGSGTEIIAKVNAYLPDHDTDGLDIRIMKP